MSNELVNVFFVVYKNYLSTGMTVYMQCEFKWVILLYFWLLEYYFSYW